MVDYSIPVDRKLFQALVKSKLTILKLDFDIPHFQSNSLISFEPSSLENTLKPNYSLRYVSAYYPKVGWKLNLLFATYCRSLRHLQFFEVDGDVLHIRFNYETKICSLSIRNYTHSVTNCEIFFKEFLNFQRWLQLENVTTNRELKYPTQFEYLANLEICDYKYSLTRYLLNELSFPNLKSLTIRIIHADQEIMEEQFRQVLQKLPELEYLKLDGNFVSNFPQWLALFEGLSKLRHFYMRDRDSRENTPSTNSYFAPSEYFQLFDVLPSLCSVLHERNYYFDLADNYALYNYDVTKKTVLNMAEQSPSVRQNCYAFINSTITSKYKNTYL